MELHRIVHLPFHHILRPQQHPQRLEDRHRPAAVIVRAGRSQYGRQEQVDAVLMRANHHRLVALPGNGRDDAGLAPRMGEDVHVRAVCRGAGVGDRLVDLRVQPGGGLGAVVGAVVAGVEGGEGLEVLAHLLLREVLHQGEEGGVVGGLGGEGHGRLGGEGAREAEVLRGGDVHELEAFLERGQSVLGGDLGDSSRDVGRGDVHA